MLLRYPDSELGDAVRVIRWLVQIGCGTNLLIVFRCLQYDSTFNLEGTVDMVANADSL